MRKTVLIGLGVVLALAAVFGFAARQKQSASNVEIVRPMGEAGSPMRGFKQAPGAGATDARPGRGTDSQPRLWERGRAAYRDPSDRAQGGKPQIGGWQAVQLALDALNAFVGIIGIGLALMGMRMQRSTGRPASHRAASHTPDRMSPNPAA